jgi:hypothetical protein
MLLAMVSNERILLLEQQNSMPMELLDHRWPRKSHRAHHSVLSLAVQVRQSRAVNYAHFS